MMAYLPVAVLGVVDQLLDVDAEGVWVLNLGKLEKVIDL